MKTLATRLSLLALIVASAGPLPSRGQDAETGQRVRFMRKKLEFSKNVLEGLAREDFDLIAKNAKGLMVMSQASEWDDPVMPNVEQYLSYTREFQRLTDELIRSGKQKNLDGATLAYVQLTVNCVNCHKYVRVVAK
jgi:hypothetical protein